MSKPGDPHRSWDYAAALAPPGRLDSSMPALPVFPLLAVALCAPLAAQTVWTVDRLNGAGTNFTDLPAAVQAAAPGDVLQVRYHDPLQVAPYTAPTITKALTVVGVGGRPGLVGDLRVQNLAPGQRVVLRELRLAPFAGASTPGSCHLRILGNQGTVHLQYVTRQTTPQSSAAANAWIVDGNRLVEFEFCSFDMVGATGTLQIRDTNAVHATSCAFQSLGPATATLLAVTNTRVVLAETLVLGPPTVGVLPIDQCNGELRLAGSNTSVLAPSGGLSIGSACGGTVRVGSGAFLGQTSGVTLSNEPVPALGGAITPSQVLRMSMFGESLGIGLIVVGDPLPAPVPLFGGDLWLDPTAAGILQVVALDLSGRGNWQLPLTAPLPTGTSAWLQGTTLGLATGFLLTPPVVVTGP